MNFVELHKFQAVEVLDVVVFDHADDSVQRRREHILVNRRAGFQLFHVFWLDQTTELLSGCELLIPHVGLIVGVLLTA